MRAARAVAHAHLRRYRHPLEQDATRSDRGFYLESYTPYCRLSRHTPVLLSEHGLEFIQHAQSENHALYYSRFTHQKNEAHFGISANMRRERSVEVWSLLYGSYSIFCLIVSTSRLTSQSCQTPLSVFDFSNSRISVFPDIEELFVLLDRLVCPTRFLVG